MKLHKIVKLVFTTRVHFYLLIAVHCKVQLLFSDSVLDKITNLHGIGGREKKDNHLPSPQPKIQTP